ncbi:MAG: entericidin A/B family lipoprotein [Sphingomonadaceae bacterium]|jgi:predicted small secreted protein|nr:entericidin A/B family lipoprotein [Sphingomonadaceae bacterium]
MKNRLITAMVLASLAVTTAACNTVKGLGRDIESVGEAGEKAINR